MNDNIKTMDDEQIKQLTDTAYQEGINSVIKNGRPTDKELTTSNGSPLVLMERTQKFNNPYSAYVKAMIEAKRNSSHANKYFPLDTEEIVKSSNKLKDKFKAESFEILSKGLTENDPAAGGYLAFPEYSSQLIKWVYPPTFLRQMPGVQVWPMSAKNLITPKQASTGNAYWGDELPTSQSEISESAITFGNITLTPKELDFYSLIGQDLIDDSNLDPVSIVEQDLQMAHFIKEEVGFMSGSGSTYQPLGLNSQMNSANVVTPADGAGATVAASITNSVYNIETDLVAAMNVIDQNYFMQDKCFALNKITLNKLYNLRTSTGALIFPELREQKNILFGHPYVVTSLTSNPNSYIYCFTPQNVIIGERQGIRLLFDPYQTNIKVYPNQHLIFGYNRVDIFLKYDKSMSYVAYGGNS